MELLSLVLATASANWDAAFTVEGFKIQALVAETSWRQLKLDKVRKVPLIHMSGDLGLATAHLPQSSSASRFTASHAGFFDLIQSRAWPSACRLS
jgi:hypothetical protein